MVYGIGSFLGFLYDKATPDLYPNNSYRKLGWAIIWILTVQSVLGALGVVAGPALPRRLGSKEERTGFIPVSMDDDAGDSSQGTEEYSSRSPSTSSWYGDHGPEGLDLPHTNPTPRTRLIDTSRLKALLSRRMPYVFNVRAVKVCHFGYALIERSLVILGFFQICLGVVAGSGIFVSGIKLFLYICNPVAHPLY